MSVDSNHDASDADDTNPRLVLPPRDRPETFRDRHALKVMGGMMIAAFTLVIVAQVGC